MAYKIKVIRRRQNLDTPWPLEHKQSQIDPSTIPEEHSPVDLSISRMGDRVGDRFVDNGIELSEDGLTKTCWMITLYNDVAEQYRNRILHDPRFKQEELHTELGVTLRVDIEEI